MSQKLQKGMYPVSPHPGRHGVFPRESTQSWAGGRMLTGEEEVMVFVQKSSVESYERLPLLMAQFWLAAIRLVLRLLCINLHALLFHL